MIEQKPRAPKGMKCPDYRGFFGAKDVSKVCHKCEFYVRLYGVNPNARVPGDMGEVIDRWGCAKVWPVLLSVQHMKELNGLSKGISEHNQIAIATSQANAGVLTGVQTAFDKLSARLSEMRMGSIELLPMDRVTDVQLITDDTA